MTPPRIASGDPPRKWYGLALRHLRVSHRLLRMGFPDAAFFHCYHAFECGLGVVIAAKGFATPPRGKTRKGKFNYYASPKGGFRETSSHKAKALLFEEVATQTESYYSSYAKLTRHLTVRSRNESLYYDENLNIFPATRYAPRDVDLLAREVFKFLRELRIEIK